MRFLKFGSILASKWKRMTQMSTPLFWGVFCEGFFILFLDWGARRAVFWHLKTGTFEKSARFQVPENCTSIKSFCLVVLDLKEIYV